MDALRQATPFGKYVLLERVSVGGMAEVFKAKAFGVEGFEKILAIKRILPSMAEDADFIEMFIDEAKICGQLNHANICQIFELGRVNESHFIAMEFVWGKDVLQMQNRFRKLRQKMQAEMAAYIVCKICEGLDYAHKKKDAQGRPLGIIHRDISPQNILISYEGELKVIDFGIAKAASRSSKTQAGVLKGKFGYMSPEQVRGLPLDRRSDIFAIGTILYELLTSERLFYGESDFETLEKVRNVDIQPVTQVNPGVPKTLERIIMRALSKDVETRYQWASEMAEELNSFLLEYDPVFTAQNLSQWMRDQFAVEMKRERLVLDEQQKVTREMASQSSQRIPAQRTAAPSAPTAQQIPVRSLLEDDYDDDFSDKTTVSPQSFDSGSTAALPDQSTRILDGQMPDAAARPTELAAQATVVFSDASSQTGLPPPKPLDSMPFTGPVDQSMMYPPGMGTGERSFTPHYGQLSPPSPPRSTLWKDIFIGVAVAAAVVGGVLGVRAYLAHRGEATLVVMSPTGTGDLTVDGSARGRISVAAPVTLKGLAVGNHTVVVRGASGDFLQNVTLAPGDVNIVNVTFAGAIETGKLKLEIESARPSGGFEPTTADVYVDGAQLSTEATKNPISMRAGAPHEVRIAKAGFAEKHFSLELRAGETQVRPVRLDVEGPKLAVTTEPAGAEVSVNGRRMGVTPTSVGDIEWSKPARISFRLNGFEATTKTVTIEHGSSLNLDVKLVAEKPEPPEVATKSTKSEGKAAAKADRPSKTDRGDKEAKNEHVDKPEVEKTDKPQTDKPVETADAKPKPEPATKPIALPSDGLAPVTFSAGDTAKPVSAEPGYLMANTQPWAKVIIDGKDTGKTTPIALHSKIALRPGAHTVTFVAAGKKYNFPITVEAGKDVRLIKTLLDAQ